MNVSINQVASIVYTHERPISQRLLSEVFAGIDLNNANLILTADQVRAAQARIEDVRSAEQMRVLREPVSAALGTADEMLNMIGDQMRDVAAVVEAVRRIST